MHREHRNQLRKKIENYSYGLSDHIDLNRKKNIFKGVNENTEERVAIKVIDLRNKETDPTLKDQLGLQIQALKKLKHPNIIRCHDVFSTVNNCYIITEFCEGGDLQNRVKTRGAFKEAQALVVFKDLLAGYLTIAHQKFVHGSLKLSSLLLKQNVVKITGFGCCRKTNKPDLKRQIVFNPYLSPESVKENVVNHKSDIWSLGMILYVLLHGQFPWNITQSLDIIENSTKSYALNPELSIQVKDFIGRALVPSANRLTLEQLPSHILLKKMMPNYSTQKYILNVLGNELLEQKNRKDNQSSHLNRVEKHINCQINWMRFLFRVLDRFINIPDEPTTQILRFIVLRQLSVQFYNLKKHFDLNQNAFSLTNWHEFSQDRDRMAKLRDVIQKNQARFEKAKISYHKLMQYFSSMNPNSSTLRGLSRLLNENFLISEYNCIFAVSASANQIKRLWEKIAREYNPRVKYEKEAHFKYKAELLLLDFIISYYQLNCLYIDDFHRQDYFQKMCKLDVTLQFQPVELDASHLEQIELKLKQLALIP